MRRDALQTGGRILALPRRIPVRTGRQTSPKAVRPSGGGAQVGKVRHTGSVDGLRASSSVLANSSPPPSLGWPVAHVAARVGVSISTLRSWERRYGLGPSGRTEGGHRRYTTDDIAAML